MNAGTVLSLLTKGFYWALSFFTALPVLVVHVSMEELLPAAVSIRGDKAVSDPDRRAPDRVREG